MAKVNPRARAGLAAGWVAGLLLVAPAARAELLTPASIAAPPPTVPAVHGAGVPADALVDDQYRQRGVSFRGAALSEVGGVTVWVPVGAPTWPSSWGPSNDEGTVNFAPGASSWSGMVIGTLTDPEDAAPATTDRVSVEFMGVAPDGVALALYDLDGNLIGNPWETSGPGPHGGVVVAAELPGIAEFQAYRFINSTGETNPWGVAQVEFGTSNAAPPPITTPEPSGLALAALGAAGLALAYWRGKIRQARSVAKG